MIQRQYTFSVHESKTGLQCCQGIATMQRELWVSSFALCTIGYGHFDNKGSLDFILFVSACILSAHASKKNKSSNRISNRKGPHISK